MSFTSKRRAKVFLACPGLGHINRGYESFTRECFDALKNNEYFDLYLIKGAGAKAQREIVINNFKRENSIAKFLSRLFNKQAYLIEQFSFCFFLLPLIIRKKPSIIYYSDFLLGTYLWHIRKLLKFKYCLLFANGAPNGPPFKTEDHIQQLLPLYLEQAVSKGEPALKQTLLPYGFNINIIERIEAVKRSTITRERLNLPSQAKIILSAGAINSSRKRMDYVISEVALLDKNYFLVILGQFDNETDEIIQLAKSKLQGRYIITSVPFKEIANYYIAADYFVLASFSEGFGRVFIEAMSYGLPCFAHDCISAKQVLKEYGTYIDMTKSGALSNCLQNDRTLFNKQELIEAAYNLYSWDVLKKDYLQMISQQIAITI